MKSITKISVIMGILLLASFELVVGAGEAEELRADVLIAQIGEMVPCDRIDEYLKYLKPNILDSAERKKVIRAFASSAQFLSPMYGRGSVKINTRQWTTYLSEGAKVYPNNREIILTLTRMLIHQKRYKEALEIITPFYMSSPCHEATAWHDYAIYKINGLTPTCNLMLEKTPEFDIHFCVITKNPKAHQKATLKQLKREVHILNKNFRTLRNEQIIKFKFKSANFYNEVKDLGCKFVELGDAKTYNTHKYAEVFNGCTHSKVRDPKAINFYVYDSYNKASGYGDNACHGKRNSNRPYLLIDWVRLNCNAQNPEAHEMGHAFGLYHVSVPGARLGSSTNIMCSTEHRFGSGGKRDLGFTEAQTAIILYHATRTSHRFQKAVVSKPVEIEIQPAIQPEANSELSLRRPITLTELRRYRDGGTLGFILTDVDGKSLSFCCDYRIGSETTGVLFVNTTHATFKGAKKVPHGSQTEKTLLSLLKAWLDDNFTKDQQNALLERQTLDGLRREDFDGWTILHFIKRFERTSALGKLSTEWPSKFTKEVPVAATLTRWTAITPVEIEIQPATQPH